MAASLMRMLAVVVLAAALLGACGGCRSRGGGGDDDADGDADGDTDGDADGGTGPRECTLGCPTAYTCNEQGVCEGGDPSDLTLDVETVPVSGVVTLNGARPSTGPDCASCSECSKATVSFTSDDGAAFSAAYAFSLDLAPGTYQVAVHGSGETYTGLPAYDTAAIVRRLLVP
jgi:hypothetical protein